MFRIFLVVLGLAAYGAYSLVERMAGAPPSDVFQEAAATTGGGLSTLGGMAVSAVANMSGLTTAALPEVGCTQNTINQENLEILLAKAPEPQREALLKLIGKSSEALTLQWYSGELGAGLCLPSQGRVVLLPFEISQSLNALALPPR